MVICSITGRINVAEYAEDIFDAIADYLKSIDEYREGEEWEAMVTRLNDHVVNYADQRIYELGQ